MCGAFLPDFMPYSIPQEVFKEALWPIVIWKENHLLNNDVKNCMSISVWGAIRQRRGFCGLQQQRTWGAAQLEKAILIMNS